MPEARILEGDCRAVLRTLDAASVQTCITSPPYYGLRDYGTATWEGGDPECGHRDPSTNRTQNLDKLGERYSGGGHKASSEGAVVNTYRDLCGKCGATRTDSQIGLEETPEQYVENQVAVFREVRRVLRDDGTLWLNVGDSYMARQFGWNNSNGRSWAAYHKETGDDRERAERSGHPMEGSNAMARATGMKPKDLIGIPWMVAFALRADGWYLRSDIIWSKPNPMPESVTDRPTKAHEYLFLLSKSPRYFWDADAVREPNDHPDRTGTNPRLAADNTGLGAHGSAINGGIDSNPAGRNKRSVWTVATQPFPGAHFATFPPKLIEPCVLAGSRPSDTVLDPFAGAGTTGLVALRHDRDFIGIELNPGYAQMARYRIFDDGPLLNAVV